MLYAANFFLINIYGKEKGCIVVYSLVPTYFPPCM